MSSTDEYRRPRPRRVRIVAILIIAAMLGSVVASALAAIFA